MNKRILVLMFLLLFLPLVGCFPAPTPPNEMPIITSTPITTATVGVLYTYDVNATDPDGDTLVYSLSAKPTNMTINSATGLINWTPVTAQVGDNSVTVKVSDGSLSITQSFTIKVSTFPVVNQAPVINSIPITTATVGVTYFYDVEATDPNGDTLIYSLTTYPSGMTISSASGLIMWTPTAAQVGSRSVTVKVSDGALSDTQSFTIAVAAGAPLTAATAPSAITLAVGSATPVGAVTNVAIPAAGATDTTGKVTGWVTGSADMIKFTVTNAGSAASTITIGGADYTSGVNYTIPSTTSLTIIVTTTETGKTTCVRTFTVTVEEKAVISLPAILTAEGGATAEWSSMAYSGSYSVLLSTDKGDTANNIPANAARVVLSCNQNLSTITDMGYTYRMKEGAGGVGWDAAPYMIFELDTIGNGIADTWVVHHMFTDAVDVNVWTYWELATDDFIPAGYWMTPLGGDGSVRWFAAGGSSGDYADWDAVTAEFGDDTVLNIKVAVGEWASDIVTAYYVDDIMINGVVYDLEQP